jgi:hypothetical protein
LDNHWVDGSCQIGQTDLQTWQRVMSGASVMSGHHTEGTVIYVSRSEPPATKVLLRCSITDGCHVMLTSLLTCRRALRAGVLGVKVAARTHTELVLILHFQALSKQSFFFRLPWFSHK